MALNEIVNRIDRTASQILQELRTGNSLISRIERIEHALFSGSGTGIVINSAAIAEKLYSSNYMSGYSGWMIDKTGYAEFEDIKVRGQLHASTFVYDAISAVGGIQMVAPASVLAADLPTVNTYTITVEDAQFSNNDFLIIKEGGDLELMKVTAGGGTTTLTVTREVAGIAQPWRKGTAVVRYMDRIVLDTVSANTPFIDIIDYTGPLYTDFDVKVRLGNLAGISDAQLNPTGYGLYSDNVFMKGRAVFGGGKVTMDTSGITIVGGATSAETITWKIGSDEVSWLYCDDPYSDAKRPDMHLKAYTKATPAEQGYADIWLNCIDQAGDEAGIMISQDSQNNAGAFFSGIMFFVDDWEVTEIVPSYGDSWEPMCWRSWIPWYFTGGTMSENEKMLAGVDFGIGAGIDARHGYLVVQGCRLNDKEKTETRNIHPAVSGTNLIRNYPSLERADGAQPDWWYEQDANVTLTEASATSNSVGGINERVLKVVNGASGGGHYVYQRFTLADEDTLWANEPISAGVWVRSGSAGTMTLTLTPSTGSPVSVSTTITNKWIHLVYDPFYIPSGATWVDFRVSHSANSGVFYMANPCLNAGVSLIPWRTRGLRYQHKDNSSNTLSANPSDVNWHIADFTSVTSNLAVMIRANVASEWGGAGRVDIRRYGDSLANQVLECWGSANMSSLCVHHCDSQQRIEWRVTNSTNCTNIRMMCLGWWEWE